jgi:hypothetical protein
MHAEVPKSTSWKAFSSEYLMIVISILTALALEHAVQTLHHRHLAHEAAERMDVELRANVKEVDLVLAHNERRFNALETMRSELLKGMRDKTDDAELMARLRRDWHDAINLSLKSPTLHREAWEAAVANQAVTWMPREQLERYATIYGAMRDKAALFNNGMISFLDGPRMRDQMSNVEMGLSNPQDIYRMASQMSATYGSFDGNMKNLKEELRQATGLPDGSAH